MSSICKDNRDRNQVAIDVSRIETARGMIGDLIMRGERIREISPLQGDHGRDKCQEIQLIRIIGTDRWVSDMGSGRGAGAGAFSAVYCSHRAQWGFWVRPANGLGSREHLRLGLMGGVGVLGAPPDELGQRWGSMMRNQSRIMMTNW
jgi:hypothetical protein